MRLTNFMQVSRRLASSYFVSVECIVKYVMKHPKKC